jgi:3-hydroxyacyl-CoA dehydrogenase
MAIERVCIVGAGTVGSLYAAHAATVAELGVLTPAGGARRGPRARRAARLGEERPGRKGDRER